MLLALVECRDWEEWMGSHSSGVRVLPHPFPIPAAGQLLHFEHISRGSSQDFCCSNAPAAWPELLCSCYRFSPASSFPGVQLQPLQPVLALHRRFPHRLLLLSVGAALSCVRRMRRRRPPQGRWGTHIRVSCGDK